MSDKLYRINDAIWAIVEDLGVRDSFDLDEDLDEVVNDVTHSVAEALRIKEIP